MFSARLGSQDQGDESRVPLGGVQCTDVCEDRQDEEKEEEHKQGHGGRRFVLAPVEEVHCDD